jgi:hypothetical protein
MRQFCVTTAMGKRLIGKGMVAHPDVKRVIGKGLLAIIAGTTNGYVAEEILKSLGQAAGFLRSAFRRGMTIAPWAQAVERDFPGDVIIEEGVWQKGKTIFDVVDDLKAGDLILKGANAFDLHGHPAVQIGHPKGGTILAALPAVIGRRVKLIVPVGLEKRVIEDVGILADRCNDSDAEGPRLFPMPGDIFTELDAIRLMTGCEASLIAAGGVLGAEGASWLGITGTEEQVESASALIESVSNEPPCEV